MYIKYSDLPAHQNLFLDYIDEFENVKGFYAKDFRNGEQYYKHFQKLSESNKPHRDKLASIIKEQYSNQRISKQTQQNIELLASPKTIAVITGQQLGIFGGPLYTILKTFTAIKLCNTLKENYDDFQFVPVFWLEADDHDYNEARGFSILSNDNTLLTLKYEDGLEEEINRGSIGELKFNENINKTFEELTNALRDTEFKASLVDLLKSIYQPNRTFMECFRELMVNLFDEYGLVIFNPADPNSKKLLVPVFKKALLDYPEQSLTLVERSAELEEIYHAQVKVKPINLFYLEGGERLLIEPTDSGEFRLKGKRKKFTQDELINQIETSPEKLSPNVLLRPICQDYLFPTGFYIGGPGEISYFAQVNPLYKIYRIEEPFIYPRASATIIEKGVAQVLAKHNVPFTDIFTNEEELIKKIIDSTADVNLEQLFIDTISKNNLEFETLTNKLMMIDKTLVDLSEKSRQKIEQTFEYLKAKAMDAQKRKHETSIRQLTKVRNVLYPNSNLQEREINLIYFVNKYGMDFMKWLFNELTINHFEHQILEL